MFRSAGPNNLYSPAATSDSSGFSELHAYNNYSTFNPVNNRNLESQQRCSSPQVPHSYHNPTLMASPYSTLPRRMTSHSSGKILNDFYSRITHCLKIASKKSHFVIGAHFFERMIIWALAFLSASLFDRKPFWAHTFDRTLFERALYAAHTFWSARLLERTPFGAHAFWSARF